MSFLDTLKSWSGYQGKFDRVVAFLGGEDKLKAELEKRGARTLVSQKFHLNRLASAARTSAIAPAAPVPAAAARPAPPAPRTSAELVSEASRLRLAAEQASAELAAGVARIRTSTPAAVTAAPGLTAEIAQLETMLAKAGRADAVQAARSAGELAALKARGADPAEVARVEALREAEKSLTGRARALKDFEILSDSESAKRAIAKSESERNNNQ